MNWVLVFPSSSNITRYMFISSIVQALLLQPNTNSFIIFSIYASTKIIRLNSTLFSTYIGFIQQKYQLLFGKKPNLRQIHYDIQLISNMSIVLYYLNPYLVVSISLTRKRTKFLLYQSDKSYCLLSIGNQNFLPQKVPAGVCDQWRHSAVSRSSPAFDSRHRSLTVPLLPGTRRRHHGKGDIIFSSLSQM